MTNNTTILPSRLRVLIIGAGRRIQNNFLPALACLSEQFEIVGIHARTTERMLPVAKKWGIPAISDLKAFDLGQVDVVAISVPTSQNAAVVRQLLPYADSLRLVIDTPIFWNGKELAAVEPLLGQFKEVRPAEDFMSFPAYQFLRKIVDSGLIGTPRVLTLFNTGYFYHGLALIRSFVGFAPVLSSTRYDSFAYQMRYRFLNGFRASIIGPYRQHHHGGVVLEGTTGIITEVEDDSKFNEPAGRKIYYLTKNIENGLLTSYNLLCDGKILNSFDVPDYARMVAMDFEDKSELNLLRGCGLIKVFQAFIKENIYNKYSYEQALYDSMISRLSKRGLLPFDPLAIVGSNVMALIKPIARFIK